MIQPTIFLNECLYDRADTLIMLLFIIITMSDITTAKQVPGYDEAKMVDPGADITGEGPEDTISKTVFPPHTAILPGPPSTLAFDMPPDLAEGTNKPPSYVEGAITVEYGVGDSGDEDTLSQLSRSKEFAKEGTGILFSYSFSD